MDGWSGNVRHSAHYALHRVWAVMSKRLRTWRDGGSCRPGSVHHPHPSEPVQPCRLLPGVRSPGYLALGLQMCLGSGLH